MENNSWEEFYRDGQGFLNTVIKNRGGSRPFNPSIVYNLICMSAEKFLMSYLMSMGKMPDNHTMYDFAQALDESDRDTKEVISELLFLDRFQSICSMENYKRKDPDDAETEKIISAGINIKAFVDEKLSSIESYSGKLP